MIERPELSHACKVYDFCVHVQALHFDAYESYRMNTQFVPIQSSFDHIGGFSIAFELQPFDRNSFPV